MLQIFPPDPLLLFLALVALPAQVPSLNLERRRKRWLEVGKGRGARDGMGAIKTDWGRERERER